jgi:hypothetical protein
VHAVGADHVPGPYRMHAAIGRRDGRGHAGVVGRRRQQPIATVHEAAELVQATLEVLLSGLLRDEQHVRVRSLEPVVRGPQQRPLAGTTAFSPAADKP